MLHWPSSPMRVPYLFVSSALVMLLRYCNVISSESYILPSPYGEINNKFLFCTVFGASRQSHDVANALDVNKNKRYDA